MLPAASPVISPREIEEFLQKFKLRELGVAWLKERGIEPV